MNLSPFLVASLLIVGCGVTAAMVDGSGGGVVTCSEEVLVVVFCSNDGEGGVMLLARWRF